MNRNTSLKALKYVLQRDNSAKRLLESLCDKFSVNFYVEGTNGTELWGTKDSFQNTIILEHEEQNIATFYYNDSKATVLFDTIKLLFQKEWEKKKIGKEVLGLYREINMIYGLSEMISEKIDAASIAEVALKEAAQIINTTHGLFLMYDSESDDVVQIAQFGDNPSSQENITKQKEVLKELIKRGTSAIVPAERVHKNPALSHLKAVMYAPLKVKHRTLGLVILGHGDEIEYTAAELKLLTTIALQSSSAIESAHLYQKGLQEVQAREEAIRKIHDASQKFVPSEFIKSLGKAKITEVVLGDLAEREVTVVFADIRDFTTISENLNPKDNFLFVNGFNNRMGPIIRKNGGFIMQYLGDGFMALFPKGSQGALNASVEMHQILQQYNEERALKKRMPVKIGIGMQNGKLIMGITGDADRLDAAIISDTVNTASRIEGLSKHYGASILLTDDCMENLTNPENFNFRFLGAVMVKGKQKPIDLYECIDGDSPKLLDHKLTTSATFQKGLDLYLNKEFAMAAVTFQRIFKSNKQDATAKLFLNKSAHLITQELGEDWKGIHSMSTK